MPDLELNVQSRGFDVERSPAGIRHMRRRERHVVGRILSMRGAKRAGALGDVRDDLARDLHGVDTLRRQRRMRLVTAHAATPRLLALVRDDELHAGRLADDAAGGAHAFRDDIGDQPAHADAADLLVIGKRKMERALEAALQKPGHERESDRRKTLHVGHTASITAGARPALPRTDPCPTAGRRPARRRCGRTVRCRRSWRCHPARRASRTDWPCGDRRRT